MKRSLFPEGVEVHQKDLERTEDTKSEEIRQRASDATRVVRQGADYRAGGIVSGLRIAVNGTNQTRIDVSPGEAYAPIGERTVVATTQVSIPMSDSTDDVKNLICLTYTETSTTARPHETDGVARNTEAVPAFNIVARTQAEFDALPETFDDITIDTRERTTVIGTVLGNDANPINAGEIVQEALHTTDIVSAAYGINVLGPIPGVNIAGHGILIPPAAFVVGENAEIKLDVVNSNTKNLSYKQEGDVSFGSVVNIVNTFGQVNLVSVTGSTLIADVDDDLLPTTDGAVTQRLLSVQPLYDVEGPLHSPTDHVLRQKKGDAAQTTGNPSGVGVNNLAEVFLRFAGSIGLGGGLLSTIDAAQSARLLMRTADSTVLTDVKTLLAEFESNAAIRGHVRVYFVGADNAIEVTVNAQWRAGTADYLPDQNGVISHQLTFGAQSTPSSAVGFSYASVTESSAFSSFDLIISSFNGASGIGSLLALGEGLQTDDAAAVRPRLQINNAASGSAARVRMLRSSGSVILGTDTGSLNVYRVNTGQSGTAAGSSTVELTFNATWNNATALWTSESPSSLPYKIEFTGSGVNVYHSPAGGPAWADTVNPGTDWTLATTFTSDGDLTVIGELQAPVVRASTDFRFTLDRVHTKSIPGASAFGFLDNSLGDGAFVSTARTTPPVLRIVSGPGTAAMWPFELPQGAVILAVRVIGTFAVGGGVLEAAVMRVTNSAFASPAVDCDSGGATSLGTGTDVERTVPVNQNNTVDNGNFSHYLHLRAESGADVDVVRVEVDFDCNQGFRPA